MGRDKSVFQFSHNRRAFSVEQLRHNLTQLLDSDCMLAPVPESAQSFSTSQIIDEPELLVGKRIKHRFQEDENLVWYTGTVLSVDDEMKFKIEYDGESDYYSFKLLDDIINGDLVLL